MRVLEQTGRLSQVQRVLGTITSNTCITHILKHGMYYIIMHVLASIQQPSVSPLLLPPPPHQPPHTPQPLNRRRYIVQGVIDGLDPITKIKRRLFILKQMKYTWVG